MARIGARRKTIPAATDGQKRGRVVDQQGRAFTLDSFGNALRILQSLYSSNVIAMVATQTGGRLIIEFLVDLFDIDTTQLGAESPEVRVIAGDTFKVFSRSTLALHTIND
jgi:hypothetical protein